MSRVSRITRGIFANLGGQLIQGISQLALVPVFLIYWDSQRYSEWLTVSAVAANLAVLDFGLQTYAANKLSQYYARGNLENYTKTFQSALLFSLAVSLIAVILMALACVALPVNEMLGFSSMNRDLTNQVVLLLTLQVTLAIPQGCVTSIYRTLGEYPRGVMINNAQRLLLLAITLISMIAGGGVLALALCQLVPMVLTAAYAIYDIRSRHPEISIGVKHSDLRLAFSLLPPSMLFLVIQLANAFTIQGTTLIVGALYGVGTVAVFVTSRTLTNVVRQITAALNHALWPELTVLDAVGDISKLREIHQLAVKSSLIVCFFAVVLLRLEGQELFRIWTHSKLEYNENLMNAFFLLLVLQTAWTSSATVLLSSNRQGLISACYLLSGVAGLFMSIWFGKNLGLPGIAVGMIVADFLICFWVIPWVTCRAIQLPFSAFAVSVLVRGVIVLICLDMVGTAFGEMLRVWPVWVRMTLTPLFLGALCCISGYYLMYDATERARVRSIVRRNAGARVAL